MRYRGRFQHFQQVVCQELNATACSKIAHALERERKHSRTRSRPIDPLALARQAAGCLHVFIDAGANIGMHTRFLFEPMRYPRSVFRRTFDATFGQQDRRRVCSFGFEPNPAHADRHHRLQAYYAEHGFQYVYVPAAVGDRADNLTFYLNPTVAGGSSHSDWSFGMKSRELNASKQRSHVVPVIDFAAFLKALQAQGRPPDGRVVVKMDIEGAEFTVMMQLLLHGVLCNLVDFISVEWHHRFLPLPAAVNRSLRINGSEGKLESWMLQEAVHDSVGCRLKDLSTVDDESYINDGAPLQWTTWP